jgi:hypothetical protein
MLANYKAMLTTISAATATNLTRAQRKLLRWHYRLGHLNFNEVKRLSSVGELPDKIGDVDNPICPACQYGKGHHRSVPDDGHITAGDLIPGACVSVDQFVSPTPGRLFTSAGKEPIRRKYTCATIFVDHASKFTHVEFQTTASAEVTVQAKETFERIAATHNVRVRHYHCDNGVFNSDEWKEHANQRHQGLSYSSVGAHHQNGVAERMIRTIVSRARTMLLHATGLWPDVIYTALWPSATKYAVDLHNSLRRNNSMSPSELFSKSKDHASRAPDMRTWGCPVYVLDAKLQDGVKLPKWDPRTRRGAFLGWSAQHASNAALVLNINTGHISPQYHVVFDDDFGTVKATENAVPPEWPGLYRSSRYSATDVDFVVDSHWRAPTQLHHPNANAEITPAHIPAPIQHATGPPPPDHPASNNHAGLRRSQCLQPPPTANKASTDPLLRDFFNSDAYKLDNTSYTSQLYAYLTQVTANPFTGSTTSYHPFAFAAKKRDPDTPYYHEAMASEDSEGFCKAMDLEIQQLTAKGVWTPIKRTQVKGQQVLQSIWAFKRKRYPDGRVRKLKARICLRGDLQEQVFETFAPVVSWATVRLLLISSVILNLHTRQIDFVNAFCQAPIETPMYMELPIGYGVQGHINSNDYVLKLNKSLYGAREAPRTWYDYLRKGLLARGFKQSALDPCLFIHKDMVLLLYVDDACIFCRDSKKVDDMLQSLGIDYELEDEGDVAAYLGIQINVNADGTVTMFQEGLIKKVISALGLDESSPKPTPAVAPPLGKALDDSPCSGNLSYSSIIGMMLYLSSNTRPDIAFAVNQCARFSSNPKQCHELALKRIGRYLMGSSDKGLILRPTTDRIQVDCYVDADFAGLWNAEDVQSRLCDVENWLCDYVCWLSHGMV